MNAIIGAGLFFLVVQNSSWHLAALLFVGMIVFFLVNLIMRQETLLYVPAVMAGMQTPADNPEGYRSPAEKGMEFEDVTLKTADGLKIHAWFIEAGGEKTKTAPTLLFCHANAGNIGLRVPNFAKIVSRLEANIFAFDYRGYGYSEGAPSEEGLIEDVLSSWKWLDAAAKAGRIDGHRVFVFGRSLGGAVAIALAHQMHQQGNALPAGLILENTFASIPMLVDSLFPMLAFASLKDRFLRLRWLSVERIPHLEVPLLFLNGQQDEVVPAWHTQALRDAATKSPLRRVFLVANGMHNDTWEKGGDAYWDAQESFIEACYTTRYPGTIGASGTLLPAQIGGSSDSKMDDVASDSDVKMENAASEDAAID